MQNPRLFGGFLERETGHRIHDILLGSLMQCKIARKREEPRIAEKSREIREK